MAKNKAAAYQAEAGGAANGRESEQRSPAVAKKARAGSPGPRLFVPPPLSVEPQVALPVHAGTGRVAGQSRAAKSMHTPQNKHETLFHRHPKNPILTAAEWPYPINTVFNAGATVLPDGQTLLLCRIEDRRGHSHLCAARSHNGVDGWEIDPEPTMMPDPDNFPEELWGIEDPRITFMPELGKYAVVYTAFSHGGPGVSLALTEDFKKFERFGSIMSPEDKDAALLPHRIGDYWAIVHRPVGCFGAHIWLSFSPDLRHWGSHRMILQARRGAWWDANKIGLSPPPIETPEGWLFIYHGVRKTASGSLYRLGLALFDLQTPEHPILRGDSWIFGPEEPYERYGDVDNVVFPCGYTIRPDGDTIHLYYGGADTCIALATGSIKELLKWLKTHGRPDVTPKE